MRPRYEASAAAMARSVIRLGPGSPLCRPSRRPRHPESATQRAFVAAVRALVASGRLPRGYGHLHAIPNGGHRSPLQRQLLAGEGVLPGVPDLFVPVARVHEEVAYHGLYLETKTASVTVPRAQASCHDALRLAGYAVFVYRSVVDGLAILSWYDSPASGWPALADARPGDHAGLPRAGRTRRRALGPP